MSKIEMTQSLIKKPRYSEDILAYKIKWGTGESEFQSPFQAFDFRENENITSQSPNLFIWPTPLENKAGSF